MAIIQNNNPNLYHFIGVTSDNKFRLIPVIAFEIEEEHGRHESAPIDLFGNWCYVLLDRAVDMVYRNGCTPISFNAYLGEIGNQGDSDLFEPAR